MSLEQRILFRRVKVREDLLSDFMQFDKYKIIGDERPDNVAEKVYGNNNLDWVFYCLIILLILIMNGL